MRALGLTAALLLAWAPSAWAQGQIIINNIDGPNEGFNDPTPAAPVGGNPGLTLGQQRLNVFNHAADLWEAALSPRVDIIVNAAFNPLGANVLGSAGTTFIFRDFPNAELPNTWYHSALADHLAGFDQNPGFADINTQFSSQFAFYLGFDNNEGTLVDLLPVVLHELGHGLGFANFVNESTGTLNGGFPDIFSQYTLDVSTGKIWNEMTVPERAASAINVRKVSWNGLHVNEAVPHVLEPGEPALRVNSPSLGAFAVGDAAFGPPVGADITGDVKLADDGVGVGLDACEPLPAGQLTGKIGLVERGVCAFTIKAKNAQDAGAIAVLVADNAPGNPPAGMAGVDPTITITTVRISIDAGNAIRAQIGGGTNVNVTLGVDTSILAGTDRVLGLMMLAAFNPVIGGSSISHFEGVARRNVLMEPAINPDLTSSLVPPEDLTLPQMTDIGWFSDQDGVPDGEDACIGSDIQSTVILDGCNSNVNNVVFVNGCSITDLVLQCADGARNHGAFVSCVSHLTNDLKKAGYITGSGKGAIQSCASGADLP